MQFRFGMTFSRIDLITVNIVNEDKLNTVHVVNKWI